MFICMQVLLFYFIQLMIQIKLEIWKKKWYEINVHDEININFFCFDIYCSRKQKLYKLYKGPNSIYELFVVEHYTAKVPFHFRDKC